MLVMASHRRLLATGSTPVLGSSKKMMGGSPTSAWATFSFRLLPPEYVPHFLSAYCLSPTKPIHLSISSFLLLAGTPLMWANRLSISLPVSTVIMESN